MGANLVVYVSEWNTAWINMRNCVHLLCNPNLTLAPTLFLISSLEQADMLYTEFSNCHKNITKRIWLNIFILFMGYFFYLQWFFLSEILHPRREGLLISWIINQHRCCPSLIPQTPERPHAPPWRSVAHVKQELHNTEPDLISLFYRFQFVIKVPKPVAF